MSTYSGKHLPEQVQKIMEEDKKASHEMYFAFENMFYAGLVLGSSPEVNHTEMNELLDLKVKEREELSFSYKRAKDFLGIYEQARRDFSDNEMVELRVAA